MRKSAVFLLIFGLIFALTGCASGQADGKNDDKNLTINLGIQQDVGPLLLAKEKGLFEKAFKKDGVKVKWTEFQSGPPQIEAISSNHLDFAAVGNSPVISAQAAGIGFKEISNLRTGLNADAILVPENSPIKSLKGLKGKKIAVAKGSSGFNLLYRALQKVGLKDTDVQIIQLQPDEAQAAFNSNKVDAWAIWEPFISYEVLKHQARQLTTEKQLGTFSPSFFIARSAFTTEHPDVTAKVLKVYEQAREWEKHHFNQSVAIYAKAKNLDKAVVTRALKINPSLNQPISANIIKAQQESADFQYAKKIISTKIDTAKVVDNQYVKKALKK